MDIRCCKFFVLLLRFISINEYFVFGCRFAISFRIECSFIFIFCSLYRICRGGG